MHEMFVPFWYVWKEETHSYTMIPNTFVFVFQVQIGVATTLWLTFYNNNNNNKSLARRGLTCYLQLIPLPLGKKCTQTKIKHILKNNISILNMPKQIV